MDRPRLRLSSLFVGVRSGWCNGIRPRKLSNLLGNLPHGSTQTGVAAEHAAFKSGATFSDGSCAYVADSITVLSVARSGVVTSAAPRGVSWAFGGGSLRREHHK